MTDLSQAIWRKARRSAHNGGCVEIAANLPAWPRSGTASAPTAAPTSQPELFAEFLADVKKGRYDME